MNRDQLLSLPRIPGSRACGCGGRVVFSHLEYLGAGRTLAIHLCRGCGLAYQGGSGPPPGAAGASSRKPLPSEGPPDNPVLDREAAERLRRLLSQD